MDKTKRTRNLISLYERFEKGTVKEQREIVGSIYPENLTFDGEHYRTARFNEAVRQIYLIEKELQENKNGTSEENFDLCRKAGLTIQFSNQFLIDLKRLAGMFPAFLQRLWNEG